MDTFTLEESTIQLIKNGECEKFKQWCLEQSDQDTSFDINKGRDVRLETADNPRAPIKQKDMTALNYAAYYGQLSIVKYLLDDQKADPTLTNEEEANALHCAVCCGAKDDHIKAIVEEVMKNQQMRRKINDLTTDRCTAFLLAVFMDLPKTVGYLLRQGADPDPPIDPEPTECNPHPVKGQNCLAMAAANDGTVLEDLLRHGTWSLEQVNKRCGQEEYTPLHYAVLYLNEKCVKLLVEAGADVKAVDYSGSCPIHFAIEAINTQNFKRMVWYLRESIDQQDCNGQTVLHLAVLINRVKLVEELMNGIPDPDSETAIESTRIKPDYRVKDREGKYPLHHLCMHSGNEELVHFLADRFVLLEKDNRGYAPLHLAVKLNNHKLVRCLLRAKARAVDPLDTVGKKDTKQKKRSKDYGRNVVHLATLCKGSDEDFKTMITTLEMNMDRSEFVQCVNTGDGVMGETPLYMAVKKGMHSRAKFLMDKGADAGVHDTNGGNSLHSAFIYDVEAELVTMLLKRGPMCPIYIRDGTHTNQECEGRQCLKERKDNKGWIPVQYLSELTPLTAVEALGEVMSCRDCREKGMEEPLDIAIRHDRLDIVEVLLEKGADVDEKTLRGAISNGNEKLASVLVKHSHNLVTLLGGEEPDDDHTTNFNELVKSMPDVAEEALGRCVEVKSDHVVFDYSFIDKHADPHVPNPMQLMVNNEHMDLLQHSVIRSYLYIQWNNLSFWYFMLFMILYGSFLVFLSLFTLTVNHPLSQICKNAGKNASVVADCGSTSRLGLAFTFAGLVFVFGIVLIISEVYRMIYYCKRGFARLTYLKDFQNWNEWFLFPMALTFVFNFANDCGCPTLWQWQVGIFAVFLAWMNLLYIASEFPKTGTYIIVFKEILVTFLKLMSFSLLLVVGFALILLMMFSNPEGECTSFSHIGLSLVRTMTMVTGELEYVSLFNLDVPPSAYTPIPFHITNFLMWIVVLVFIPIVLSNMLTSLAVGDTNEVIAKADLQKLTLQVQTVLKSRANTYSSVKAYMLQHVFNLPGKRRKFGYDEFDCFWSWARLQLFIWGGKEFVKENQKYYRESESQDEQPSSPTTRTTQI